MARPATLLYDYDQTTGKRATVTRERTTRLLNVDFSKVRRDEFGVRMTTEGDRWGLREPWVALFSVEPKTVTTVLAYDEYGRAAAWVKNFGGPLGTGFVRLWGRQEPCRDLLSVQAVAEYGLN